MQDEFKEKRRTIRKTFFVLVATLHPALSVGRSISRSVGAFLVADTQLYKMLCPSVRPSVGWSVRNHESKSEKTRISAPAHPSATDGRVSGLVHNVVGYFLYCPCPLVHDWDPVYTTFVSMICIYKSCGNIHSSL